MLRDKLERIGGVVRKEFTQLFRDERMRRMIFISPLMQLIIFGYAVSTDVRNVSLFVVDHDRTQASRALVDALTAADYFRVVGRSDRAADIADVLDHGGATVALQIPPGYARDLATAVATRPLGQARGARVQLVVDGTNSNVATIALGYAEQIIRSHGLSRLDVRITPPVDLRERAWFNPALISRNYNIPAVIGTIMLMMSLVLTALAVVRERELGTLEQLMVSPLTPGELIAGKTIPFGIVAMFDLVAITALALAWFRIPFVGEGPLLLLAAFLFLMSALGLGLLISTVSNTQQEAFLTSFFTIMPAMMLSGFMFPVTSMPHAFQWLTLLNPLRHYLEIVRAVFLKGSGLDALWPQFTALAVMGVTVVWFAATRFHKTVR
jgi:ABC-2 type transport system permease protein